MQLSHSTLGITLGATLFVGGCITDDVPGLEQGTSEEIGSQRREIINGQPWANDPATVALTNGFGNSRSTFCTGSLIAPNVVLTAAHCVVFESGDEQVTTPANQVRIVVGASDRPEDEVEVIQVAQIFPHRGYDTFAAVGAGQDIALMRLSEDALTAPIPWNRTALTPDLHRDLEIRIVGYGNDDGLAGTGSGTKRIATGLRIASLPSEFIEISTGTGASTCQGDSGGPTFGDPDGTGERVLAVASFVNAGCMQSASNTRTDLYADFIDEVLAAWTGPCAFDGTCVETGCGENVVDPDCDPCGLNGLCQPECPQVDLDCPIGTLAGATCTDEFECEDRNCIAADDDPSISFCAPTCDPAVAALEQCPAPLSACEQADDGEFYCGFAGPTPRALGAACSGPGDCNSDLCDTEDGICVVPCPSEGCPDGFECRSLGGTEVCALPGGGGGGCGCSANPTMGAGTVALSLLVGMFFFGFRRRRRAIQS